MGRRKLPKNPEKGSEHTIITNPGGNLGKREVTFKATGRKGFGKYKIKEIMNPIDKKHNPSRIPTLGPVSINTNFFPCSTALLISFKEVTVPNS